MGARSERPFWTHLGPLQGPSSTFGWGLFRAWASPWELDCVTAMGKGEDSWQPCSHAHCSLLLPCESHTRHPCILQPHRNGSSPIWLPSRGHCTVRSPPQLWACSSISNHLPSGRRSWRPCMTEGEPIQEALSGCHSNVLPRPGQSPGLWLCSP